MNRTPHPRRPLEPPPRYSRRLVVLEEPEIVERVRRVANESGMSMAAAVRLAIRRELLDIEAAEAADGELANGETRSLDAALAALEAE